MGSSVERLLEKWEDEACNQYGEIGLAFKGIANELREAIEADREEGIEVEVVATNTHEAAEGDWYASWTIICEDETLDELDDLPKYGTLIKREAGDSEEEA